MPLRRGLPASCARPAGPLQRLLAASAFALTSALAATAAAQDPGPPPLPPPGFEQQPAYGQPPPGVGQPPPGYTPPPGYAVPPGYAAPPGYAPLPGYGAPPAYGYPVRPELLGPREMDYEDGDPVPAGYHVDTRIRRGLVIGGAVTFGSTYLLTALTATAASEVDNDFTPLFVPVVGPFITIGSANASGAGAFWLAFDGVVQSAGVTMLVIGLAAPRTVLVRDDVGRPSLSLAPVALGSGTMGLGVVGSM